VKNAKHAYQGPTKKKKRLKDHQWGRGLDEEVLEDKLRLRGGLRKKSINKALTLSGTEKSGKKFLR